MSIKHAYNADGEIIEQGGNIYDESLKIVDAAEIIDPNSWHYVQGILTAKPVPTAAEVLARARETALGELLISVNRFIAQKPDGKTRYDTNLKLNLLDWRDEIRDINADTSATTEQLAWAAAAGPLIASVKAWIKAVQDAYLYDRKAAISAAANLAALEAVDISYGWFEERYGLAGTVLADPDIYTSDITEAGQ